LYTVCDWKWDRTSHGTSQQCIQTRLINTNEDRHSAKNSIHTTRLNRSVSKDNVISCSMYSFKDFYSGVLFSDICTLTFVLFWMQATFCSAASFVSWPREAVLPTTIHHSTSRQRKNVSFTTVPFTDFCVCVTEQHSTKQTMTIDTLRLHTTKNTMTTSS